MIGSRGQYRDQHDRRFFTTPLALGFGVRGELTIPVPLTEAEWSQMLRLFEVMRPGLVEERAVPDDVEREEE